MTSTLAQLNKKLQQQNSLLGLNATGYVHSCIGDRVLAKIPHASIGQVYQLRCRRDLAQAEVTGFESDLVSLTPLQPLVGLSPGAKLSPHSERVKIQFKPSTGQLLGALGESLAADRDDLDTEFSVDLELQAAAPAPLSRGKISEQLVTGIRSIDLFCPLAKGQRIGLFAGPGAGKSTLIGQLAKSCKADVTVVGLIGERGREVPEFVENCLGEFGMQSAVVVASTSDELSLRRYYAAKCATAIAEYFRSQGKDVLLVIDSLTRVARAIRERGLAAGELPVRHGYTPSVFTEMPKLLERPGVTASGSITAVYTVLTEDGNLGDPLADEVKSLVDGHIVLDQNIANWGVRPAIDLERSLSRLAPAVQSQLELKRSAQIRATLSTIKSAKETLSFGGEIDQREKSCLEKEDAIKLVLNNSSKISEVDPLLAETFAC